jgi:hypothetical protein
MAQPDSSLQPRAELRTELTDIMAGLIYSCITTGGCSIENSAYSDVDDCLAKLSSKIYWLLKEHTNTVTPLETNVNLKAASFFFVTKIWAKNLFPKLIEIVLWPCESICFLYEEIYRCTYAPISEGPRTLNLRFSIALGLGTLSVLATLQCPLSLLFFCIYFSRQIHQL